MVAHRLPDRVRRRAGDVGTAGARGEERGADDERHQSCDRAHPDGANGPADRRMFGAAPCL